MEFLNDLRKLLGWAGEDEIECNSDIKWQMIFYWGGSVNFEGFLSLILCSFERLRLG